MTNAANAKNSPVSFPFLGLFFDRAPWAIDPKGFMDCNNVRIFEGEITSFSMGWTLYTSFQFNGAITLLDLFQFSNGSQLLIIGTPTDLYSYNAGTPIYITPVYTTGTVTVNNGSPNVTGSGTLWNTAVASGQRKNIRAGDFVFVGSVTQNSPGATWYKVLSVTDDTHLVLTANYSGSNASGQAYTGRQTFAGDTNVHHWTSENFPGAGSPDNSDLWFATNGADLLFKWNGVTTFGVLVTTMPFVAFELKRFKNMMVYGGLIQNGVSLPSSIANSDNNLPISMNTGIAGQFIVSDGPYTINHLGILGNVLMIYMGNVLGGDVVSAQFVGPPLEFVFSEVIRGRGPIFSRAVIEFPDRHQFIGSDGEYRYNGLFVQLMNQQVWRHILASFDISRADQGFCVTNQQFGDMLWAIPSVSDTNTPGTNTAWVEHYLEQPTTNYLIKPYTKRDFPFTAVGFVSQGAGSLTWNQMTNGWNTYNFPFTTNFFTGSYPLMITGDRNGFVYTMYNADTQNGAAYTSFVLFPPRVTVNERSRGLVKRIYPFADRGVSEFDLTVTLYGYDTIGNSNSTGNASFIDNQILDLTLDPGEPRFTSHYRRARVANVKFSTAGPNQPWTLSGYDWDTVEGGLAG